MIIPWKSYRFWLILASILLVVFYSMAIVFNQSTIVEGKRAYWLQDDMMISMRYARNLASGAGLVWNPGGERVEGYSNFGWVMVMALVHLLPLPVTHTSLVVLAINVGLAIVVLWLSGRLMRVLVPGQVPALITFLLALILATDLARWTTIGLETTLLTVLFLWLVLRVLKEAQEGRPLVSTYIAAGLLGIVRADGLLYAGLICWLAFMLNRDKRRALYLCPLVLVFPAFHLLFRLSYYGDLFPNTYYLKMTGWRLGQRLLAGLRYVLNYTRYYGIASLIAVFGVWYSRDRLGRALLLMGLPIFGYALYIGGDDFSGARFFAPWLPVLLVLTFLTPGWLEWKTKPARYYPGLIILLLVVVIFSGYNFFQGPGFEAKFLKAGLFLRRSTLPETRIANIWAGTLPYFADRTGVDLLGKNDAYVARLPVHPDSSKPGHNKYEFGYSLGVLRPDLVIQAAHPSAVTDAKKLAEISQGDDAYLGQLYLNDLFREQYAGNLIIIDQVPIFIRRDSDELDRLMEGECSPVKSPELTGLGLENVCFPEN